MSSEFNFDATNLTSQTTAETKANPKAVETAGNFFTFNAEVAGTYQNFGGVMNIYQSAPAFATHLHAEGFRPTTQGALGREATLNDLRHRLDSNPNHCLVITGLGGLGKSVLASLLYENWQGRYGQDSCVWVRCADQNASRTTSINDIALIFAAKTLHNMADFGQQLESLEKSNSDDQLGWLLEKLKKGHYLLVLDNFESLLTPDKSTLLPDKLMLPELLEAACQGFSSASRVVLTSREFPKTAGRRPLHFEPGKLEPEVGVALLQREFVNREIQVLPALAEMKKAVGSSYADGNPQFLLWLAQLVEPEAGYTLAYLLEQPQLWQDDIAANLLERVWHTRLNTAERLILTDAAILRAAFMLGTLKGLALELKHQEVARDLERLALRLRAKSLLESNALSTPASSSESPGNPLLVRYNLHAQVRQYLLQRQLDQNERTERHLAAASYFKQQPVPKLEERQGYAFPLMMPLIEAFFQLVEAHAYDEAITLLYSEGLNKDLQRWGQFNLLLEIFQSLLDKSSGTVLTTKAERRANVPANIGLAYYLVGQYQLAIRYFEQGLEASQQLDSRTIEVELLGNLALVYGVLSQYEQASQYLHQSLAIARQLDDKSMEGQNLINLGNTYFMQGRYQQAAEFGQEALTIVRQIEDKQLENIALANIGNAYRNLGQYQQALAYQEQSLSLAREIGDRQGESIQLNDLGSTMLLQGYYPAALEFYQQALVIAQEIGDRQSEGVQNGNLGLTYLALKQPLVALVFCNRALQIAREIGDKQSEANHLGNLGSCYYVQGQFQKAIAEYHLLALAITKEIGDRGGEGCDLGSLGNAYAALDDNVKAAVYYSQARAVFVELGLEERVVTVTELAALIGSCAR